MSGQGRTMQGASRNASTAYKRMVAPQEVYRSAGSDATSHLNPLETFAPGVMTHDGAFADSQDWNEPSFEDEALAFNSGRGFSEPAQTLNARQQFGTLFESPSVGAEQTGIFTRNAQVEKPSAPKSGTIFDGYEHTRQQKLHNLRQENHLPQQQDAPRFTEVPAVEEKSTITRSAAQYEADRTAQIEQIRLSLKAQRKKPHATVSGENQLTMRKVQTPDLSTFTLMERVMRFVQGDAQRQSALDMYTARASKKTSRKGPVGLDMGDKESRSDAVGEMMRSKVEREAGHELDLQAD